MKRRLVLLVPVFLFGVAGPTACSARRVSDSASDAEQGVIDGGGDFGTGVLPGGAFEATGGAHDLPQGLEPHDCVGAIALGIGGDYRAALDEPDGCLACATVGRCRDDADCAAGAQCDGASVLPGRAGCIRECNSDEDCTEGRECLQLPGRLRETVQLCGLRSNDAFACAALEGDPCRSRTDEASCEALAYGGALDVRCDWVVETLVADAGTCEILATEGHCVPTVPRTEESCDERYGCRSDGAEVSYRDHGAATFGVFVIPPSRQLASVGGENEVLPIPANCDFSGGAGIPAVCRCAS